MIASDDEFATPREGVPTISVIVPVRNGGFDLPHLIAALENQLLPRTRFEVIVADDGSTDGCCDTIETRDGWLRVDRGDPQNSYAARNRAAQLARAPAFAFCDADCRPEPGWLRAGLEALAGADLVAGAITPILPPRLSAWSLIELESFKDQRRLAESGVAETANLFVRRRQFEAAGGFDESLPSGGDYEFVSRCVRHGGRLAYAPDAVVGHTSRTTAKAFLAARWRVQKARAARQAREGVGAWRAYARPFYIPFLGMIRTRRDTGLPARLDRAKLAARGVHPTPLQEFRALAALYGVLPYVALGAKISGRRAGRGSVSAMNLRATDEGAQV